MFSAMLREKRKTSCSMVEICERRAITSAAAPPPMVHATVVRDAIQPGREPRFRPVALAMCDHARPALLEDVVRRRGVRNRAADEAPQRAAMVRVERIERTRIACGVTQHQLRVGVAFSHRPQLYPEGSSDSFFNARKAPEVFDSCAKFGMPRPWRPFATVVGGHLYNRNPLYFMQNPDKSNFLLKKGLHRSRCYS